MDWPVTRSYVEGLGGLYGLPVRVSFREGGFLQELMRRPGDSRGRKLEDDGATVAQVGRDPAPNDLGRRRFPALTADLRVRWCSSELKIDVARAVVGARVASGHRNVLLVSGERASESAPRARYHRGQDSGLSSGKRLVHQLRLVYDHTDAEVWEELRTAFPGKHYGIQPHPAYELGWGRCSCAGCIFSSNEDWRRLRDVLPAQFARIADAERRLVEEVRRQHPSLAAEAQALRSSLTVASKSEGKAIRARLAEIALTLGRTISPSGRTIPERADMASEQRPTGFEQWRGFADGSLPWTTDHMLRGPGAPIFREPWTLPDGALNLDSAGPPT
jgi:3'-phosphoadenosine 5'-phosphosulfate sulfotransferase (PAPS reductase)/FAD synthetase